MAVTKTGTFFTDEVINELTDAIQKNMKMKQAVVGLLVSLVIFLKRNRRLGISD